MYKLRFDTLKELELWKHTLKNLEKEDQVIVIVTEAKGSSPGKKGFKMLVAPNGRIFGTIGGGIMEARIIDQLKSSLSNNDNYVNYEKELFHRKGHENASGLNCSGSQKLLFLFLKKSYKEQKNKITRIIDEYYHNLKLKLIVKKDGFDIVENEIYEHDDTLYEEYIAQPYRVYIFGAGHVGSAVATQLSFLGFYVTLYDLREEVVNFDFKRKYDVLKTGELSNLAGEIIEHPHSFIVITSNSVEADIEALKLCLNKEVGYIGFMGSKTKIKMAKNALSSNLENVHAPIGIEIPNETPQEIAVSIAAEIISIKNSQNKI